MAAAPPCPHSPPLLRRRDHIPLPNDRTSCLICFDTYFSRREDGSKVRPALLPCNHVFCNRCMEEHREYSLLCPNNWCDDEAAPLSDTCERCIEWASKYQQLAPTKVVVMVDPKPMLSSLKSYFADLASSHKECKLTLSIRRTLFGHFETTLLNAEGWVFDVDGLAEVLDPLLAIQDRAYWLKKPYGKKLAKPAPSILVDASLPANEQNRDLWPNDEEPWISTVLRIWAKVQIDAEGEVKDADFKGYSTRRHEREGTMNFEFAIKQILDHRLGEDGGEKEYLVQWVGYPMPKYYKWVARAWMSGPGVHAAYDRLHSI
ncbi:hypothetical protein BDW02DRAFT_385939 [Decorospora gaudefroyi]|uniref:RING-type domain-containing protein n=1 Tax=Decorospora gaudefroyi TaxID=184978 RepID=A0A6A5KAC2_9PLEO|nr:hypothetical protein BDW02DRAFT_385939 [Decorospora gaudefroyi]